MKKIGIHPPINRLYIFSRWKKFSAELRLGLSFMLGDIIKASTSPGIIIKYIYKWEGFYDTK